MGGRGGGEKGDVGWGRGRIEIGFAGGAEGGREGRKARRLESDGPGKMTSWG